jgi:tRNA(Arg) A34 adenosine deaminase TadA
MNEYSNLDGIYVTSARELRGSHMKFIEMARSYARRSIFGHKHGCVVVRNNKVVALACNVPCVAHDDTVSFHAEATAIKYARNVIKKEKLTDCEIYIVRIGSDEKTLKNSKPCMNCQREILKAGIRKCYFTMG